MQFKTPFKGNVQKNSQRTGLWREILCPLNNCVFSSTPWTNKKKSRIDSICQPRVSLVMQSIPSHTFSKRKILNKIKCWSNLFQSPSSGFSYLPVESGSSAEICMAIDLWIIFLSLCFTPPKASLRLLVMFKADNPWIPSLWGPLFTSAVSVPHHRQGIHPSPPLVFQKIMKHSLPVYLKLC